MSKSLSLDVRTRVLAAIAEGLSCRQAAARFGVSVSSAIRWRALERTHGHARPKALGGDRRSRRIEAYPRRHASRRWTRRKRSSPRRGSNSRSRRSPMPNWNPSRPATSRSRQKHKNTPDPILTLWAERNRLEAQRHEREAAMEEAEGEEWDRLFEEDQEALGRIDEIEDRIAEIEPQTLEEWGLQAAIYVMGVVDGNRNNKTLDLIGNRIMAGSIRKGCGGTIRIGGTS